MPAAKNTEPKTVGEIIETMPVVQEARGADERPPQAAVYIAIAAITDALGREGISKDRESSGTGEAKFRFRGIEDVYAALNPLLAQHSLCILPRVLSRELHERRTSGGKPLFDVVVEVEWDIVSALDGSKHTIRTIGEAMDMSDKATNKAMSIAYKYAAFLTFAIPVAGQDDDPDRTTHDVGDDGASSQQRSNKAPAKNSEPEISKEDADKAFLDGKQAMEFAADMATLKEAFEQINWSKIPAGWKPHLVKIKDDQVAKLKAPAQAPAKTSVPPNFGDAPDDDIPF